MSKMRSLGLLLTCVFVFSGCGESAPEKAKVFPVSGKVTVGGAPLDGYMIIFGSTTTGDGASATTKSDGTYTLAVSDGRPGCVPGKYKVVIKPGAAAMQAAMANVGPGGPKVDTKVPGTFGSAETSPKEVEVKAESNTINIEI